MIWSRAVVCSAMSTGLWRGIRSTPVINFMEEVAAANLPRRGMG